MASGAANVVGPKICLEDNVLMSGVKNNVGRGINIALVNGKTGEVIDTKFFDMWGGGTCAAYTVFLRLTLSHLRENCLHFPPSGLTVCLLIFNTLHADWLLQERCM